MDKPQATKLSKADITGIRLSIESQKWEFINLLIEIFEKKFIPVCL